MSWLHFGQVCSQFLLILCIVTLFNNVEGVPSASIVTKARCYANCLTQNTPANETEKTCQTSICEECLIPCGTSFSDEETCKQSCNNATSCEESCAFLAQLQNFSSILAGDGSLPPKPSMPTVTSKNFTSISLKWDPVQNTNGTAVYLIEITFTGEQSRFSPSYLSEIFVGSQATVKFEHPCLYTKRSPFKSEYKDILFSFKIAVLTENSSVSYGPETPQIILTKPDSVTKVTLDSIFYDSANLGDKIKLTVSFIPPKGQEELISHYGALFLPDPSCELAALPRAEDSKGAEATLSMHIFHKSLKCNHTLEIYSIVGCSVSDATVFNYTYPGCQNITDFPTSECYKFDPPYAPLKDRMVSNVTLEEPMTAQQDYRFTAAVTWNPPVYPYKTPIMYIVKWSREDSFVGSSPSFTSRQTITNLLPGTSFIIEIRPMFPDGKPLSAWTSFILTTPGVDPDQVKVRQLTYSQFSPSPDGGSFSVHISWEKPTFNYSTLASYQISYSKGSNNDTNVELNIRSPTSFVISGVLHGENVYYRVIPRYHDDKWIKGITVTGNATAPVPRDDEIRVQNLQFGVFARAKGNTTFSVNCTWTGPTFNFTLRSYEVEYELSGYPSGKPSVRINVNTPESYLSGIRPKEFVTIKVTPKFDNPNIKRLEKSTSTTAPEPDPSVVIIQNLTFIQLNTSTSEKYDYLISWQKPQFTESDVSTYAIEYQRTGNPDRTRLWKTKEAETFFSVQDLIPGDNLEVKVTPEFVATVVIGIPSQKVIEPPGPDIHEIQVQNLRSESFVKGEEINTFKVNFTWEGPSFKHSVAHSYIVSYEFLGGYSRDQISCSPFVRDNDGSGCSKSGVNLTFLQISGIYPRESVTVKVTPIFVNPHIQKLELSTSATAPEPDPSTVKVQNLTYTERNTSTLEQFDYLISWQKPLFKESSVMKYAISYKRTGNPDRQKLWQFKTAETFFPVDDLIPGDKLEIKVTPEFAVNVITGISSQTTIEPQSPENKEIQVANLQSGVFVEDQDSNTFSVNFTWERPSFQHSIVHSYIISYKFDGYSREQISCSPGLVRDKDRSGCSKSEVNQTLLQISGIFPREAVTAKITPIFSNIHITGKVAEERVTAPRLIEDQVKEGQPIDLTCDSLKDVNDLFSDDPVPQRLFVSAEKTLGNDFTRILKDRSSKVPQQVQLIVADESHTVEIWTAKMVEPAEELVQVNDLEYDFLVPTFNDTFRTTVSWKKPKFTHSDVRYYKYKVLPTDSSQRERRGTALNAEITTTSTNATIEEISRADGVEFQVTPVFVVPEVLGADAKISLVWKLEADKETVADSLSTSELVVLVVGLLLAVLIMICVSLWCYREKQRQQKAGRVSGKNALMIDHWEVDGDLVTLEEELGEGAFGKVYKGILKELSTPSRKMSMMPPMKSTRKNTIKQTGGFTVAVKMLHDMADGDQRREFLEEIQLMKAVGSHKNIVNMLGCCTVEEPMFLLVEYIPYGDLLHYLRKRRGKVKEYLGDESRGPYRSTYCETYVIDRKAGGISIQATKSDRIYVNSPEAQAGENGNIAILSFKQSSKLEEQGGIHNEGMTKEDEADDEEDESEETLTPGDLMAFAWQISEGMEYLARKGFVHRDLAARNVLVGEHKIAKVADFGLTRHVYEEKVYHAKRNRKLPLKWMSIEAIFDQTFTTQSDVWAFGVVLWELVTLGGTPYPTINNRELLRLLKGGYRMEKPDICNDEMFSMMTDCWMENPDDRPNFTQIRERLEEMMQKDNPYLDFSVLDESRDYYNVPSFNSLNEESADDELSDKESDELLKDESDDSSVGEKPTEDSNKNEIAPFPKAIKSPEMDHGIDSVGVDKIEFNNSSFRGEDFRDLKDVKVNIDALEMALYRPGNRGLVL